MEGKKLRIAMINNTKNENPSFVMRNKIVGQKLEERGHDVFYKSMAFNFDHDDYDVFIFNRFYEGTLLPTISFLKKIGKTIIYETDDSYESIDQNNPFMKIKDFGVLSSRELIKLADGVTVSTPELKAEILERFPDANVFVIPNALNFSEYKKRKGKNKKVKIGFQGSNIHVQDLLIVIDAIKQLQEEHGVEFYLFGIDDKPLKDLYKFCLDRPGNEKWKWMDDFIKLYEKLEDMEYLHVPAVYYEKFRESLSKLNLDIGIAPLTDTRFNRAKSCLKFYEYAAVGTVTLASNVLPYSNEMDKEDLVKNRHRDWYNKLKKLVEDESYRQQRLYAQEAWVNEERNIDKVVEQWENAIYKIKNK